MSGYLRFQRTGLEVVDDILSTIERAGDAFHHTSQWQEKTDWLDGKSCDDLIDEKIAIARTQLSAMQPSEPVAYRQHVEVTKNGVTTKEYGYSDIQIMQGDDALYLAPPSAEVLVEALRKLDEFNVSLLKPSQYVDVTITNALTTYEAKLLQKEG